MKNNFSVYFTFTLNQSSNKLHSVINGLREHGWNVEVRGNYLDVEPIDDSGNPKVAVRHGALSSKLEFWKGPDSFTVLGVEDVVVGMKR